MEMGYRRMVVKLAKLVDAPKIQEYCDKHGFYFPTAKSLYVVWQEEKIIGIAGLELIVKIEPFIADNPIAAKKLYEQLIQLLKDQDIKSVECFSTNAKLTNVKALFEKLGFQFAEQTNRFIKKL